MLILVNNDASSLFLCWDTVYELGLSVEPIAGFLENIGDGSKLLVGCICTLCKDLHARIGFHNR